MKKYSSSTSWHICTQFLGSCLNISYLFMMYFDHIHLPCPSPCHLPPKFVSCIALDFYNPLSPISAVSTATGVEHGQPLVATLPYKSDSCSPLGVGPHKLLPCLCQNVNWLDLVQVTVFAVSSCTWRSCHSQETELYASLP